MVAIKTKSKKSKETLCVLVLAGGKGTRMKSPLPKPLHKLCGREILAHILLTSQNIKPDAMGILLGHQAGEFRSHVEKNYASWGVKTAPVFTYQKALTGSATAVKDSFDFIKKYDNILILSGDAPLVRPQTLRAMYADFKKKKAAASVFTVNVPDPFGYGRILHDDKGGFLKIVEQLVATPQERAITEINAGMYLYNVKALWNNLKKVLPKGVKQEFYLPDTIEHIREEGGKVVTFRGEDYTEALGINSKSQLAEAEAIMRKRKTAELMDEGVTIIKPSDTYIDSDVKIGADTTVFPGTYITGKTVIGKNCLIEPNCFIDNSKIADEVAIHACTYIESSDVGPRAALGPFAHLRKGSVLKEKAKVGNFSETKNAVLGKGAKLNHLSYLGDAEVGDAVNIGAGTITCNYDGVNKHKTVIGANSFIGSNTNLVAPVTVGKGVLIAAGSTITENIKDGRLAIARSRQVVKERKNKK